LPTINNRAHERYPCNFPVTIRGESRQVEGTAINISLGGMLVQCSTVLVFGSTVKLRFRLPAMTSDTEVDAAVRWNKDNAYGLQFGSLRARDVWGLNRLFEKSGG